MRFLTKLRTFHAQESGQDLVEYALVLAAMAFAVVAGSGSVANVMSNALTAINTKISGAIASIS